MTNHCTYEQSLALKEIGFDMPVRDWYTNSLKGTLLLSSEGYQNFNISDVLTSAPTHSEVLQWAREKHGIDAWVEPYYTMLNGKAYGYTIFNIVTAYEGLCTHPEAESALVDKIIELIKEKITTPSAE